MPGAQKMKKRMAFQEAEAGWGREMMQCLVGLVKEDLGLYSKGKRKNLHRGMTELDLSLQRLSWLYYSEGFKVFHQE